MYTYSENDLIFNVYSIYPHNTEQNGSHNLDSYNSKINTHGLRFNRT